MASSHSDHPTSHHRHCRPWTVCRPATGFRPGCCGCSLDSVRKSRSHRPNSAAASNSEASVCRFRTKRFLLGVWFLYAHRHNSPLQTRSVLFRVERPVLVHIVPNTPVQVIRVIPHIRYCLQDVGDLRLLTFLNAFCQMREKKGGDTFVSGGQINLTASQLLSRVSSHRHHLPDLTFAYNSGFLYGLTANK